MAQYFLLLDAAAFHEQIRPALAACWRQRRLEPCRALAKQLLAKARQFAERYHLGPEEPLLAEVAKGLPFERMLWQHLVGEILWFSAVDIPELRTADEALQYLLAPEETPLRQLHRGSREVTFGGGFYRPDAAGWNDCADVARLVDFQQTVRPSQWRAEALSTWAELPADDRGEELEYARECWTDLETLYRKALETRCIVVCETL